VIRAPGKGGEAGPEALDRVAPSTSTGPSGKRGAEAGSGGPEWQLDGKRRVAKRPGRGGAGGSCLERRAAPTLRAALGTNFVPQAGRLPARSASPSSATSRAPWSRVRAAVTSRRTRMNVVRSAFPTRYGHLQKKGQQAYAEFRRQLIEKYNSMGCRLSRGVHASSTRSNRCRRHLRNGVFP